jgi:putative phage-type endonuclease
MNIVECGGQGTESWWDTRLGMLTSSRIADAIGKRKRGNEELKGRADLKLELAVERLTRKPSEHFVSEWMFRGSEMEPLARAAYEMRTGETVQLIDFLLHPDRERLLWGGASPDGLCDSGLIEIKVPKPSTHARYLLAGCVPSEYVPQMMWQMACCPEAKVNTFVSYCPDFPEPMNLFICRLERDDVRIAEMEAEAVTFLAEVEALTDRLKGGIESELRKSFTL